MKRAWLLAVACIATMAHDGYGQDSAKWLVIAASKPNVVPVLDATRRMQASWPHAAVVASSDCQALRPGLYLAVAEVAADRATASAALQKLKSDVPDAYLKECHPKPNTTLQVGIPLVDPSIASVPTDSVNWSDSDRISSVRKLPEKGYLWIRRRYVFVPEDPREGRRESVFYFEQSPEKATELRADCSDPEDAQRGELVALSCATEIAGDNLLHETIVYDTASGKATKSIPHCRKPAFDSATDLTCKAESVNAEGVLKLECKRVPLR